MSNAVKKEEPIIVVSPPPAPRRSQIPAAILIVLTLWLLYQTVNLLRAPKSERPVSLPKPVQSGTKLDDLAKRLDGREEEPRE